MSKAEERALEAYPIESHEMYDDLYRQRNAYFKGYHQAEKDNALNWEDVKEICDIAFEEACRLQRNMKSSLIYKEQHYQEVLKRFLKEREER